jgi:primosomal protein N' (replication factor Y)
VANFHVHPPRSLLGPMTHWLFVLVQTPAHAALGSVLSYRSESALPPGTLVRVPLGQRETLGIVWNADSALATGELDPGKIRTIVGTLDGIAPLNSAWQQLVTFAAQYYQRSLGEVALAALPPQLRELSPVQMQRRLQRRKPQPATVSDALVATWRTRTTRSHCQA